MTYPETPRQEGTPMTTELEHLPGWVPLAARALHQAQMSALDIAARTVERMAREHGPETIPKALNAWCDALLTAYGMPNPEDVHLGRVNGSVFEVTGGPDGLSPHTAWAGQYLAARAANDKETGEALAYSAADPNEWSRRVMALLELVAFNLNHHQVHPRE